MKEEYICATCYSDVEWWAGVESEAASTPEAPEIICLTNVASIKEKDSDACKKLRRATGSADRTLRKMAAVNQTTTKFMIVKRWHLFMTATVGGTAVRE